MSNDEHTVEWQQPDPLRSWVMTALVGTFVVLYVAALIGWLKPLPDPSMVVRLESLIFAIFGYYFGRLPGQQNERTLKAEVASKSKDAAAANMEKDAARKEKETAQVQVGALEEKRKHAAALLRRIAASEVPVGSRTLSGSKDSDAALVAQTALEILQD